MSAEMSLLQAAASCTERGQYARAAQLLDIVARHRGDVAEQCEALHASLARMAAEFDTFGPRDNSVVVDLLLKLTPIR